MDFISVRHFPVPPSSRQISFLIAGFWLKARNLNDFGILKLKFLEKRNTRNKLEIETDWFQKSPIFVLFVVDLSSDSSSCCGSSRFRYCFKMGKGNKEGTSKQFRWTKPMEHIFLEILAEEAKKGNKPSNTFKAVSINRIAEAIAERFQVQYDAKHVENHLRTVKNQWQIICTIRGESGFGWDDNMKMITCVKRHMMQ
ncbi:uncharacterized protein [Gossypium hirsutum]|uniref:Uncharacterized protein isoform X1 n=1 Tax=Gossypium hirsutum TaxID=3635 RepID=A0A1U8IKT4_GOSHI|nr:uncharacterized protein LOC107897710 isoform X1 [Gossypium hirsutum]